MEKFAPEKISMKKQKNDCLDYSKTKSSQFGLNS